MFGVVHHSGSAQFGHYVSEVRDLNVRNEEKWFLCNDASIQTIDEPELDSDSAYLLFYVKTDESKPLHYNAKNGLKKTQYKPTFSTTRSSFVAGSTFSSSTNSSTMPRKPPATLGGGFLPTVTDFSYKNSTWGKQHL